MQHSPIIAYLSETSPDKIETGFLAYLANLTEVAKVSPETVKSIIKELADQRTYMKLIASENYSSLATQLAMGNLLTDKYAEGFPHHRFYAGCDNVDDIEAYACEQAKKLFGCEHAYVQPHSGADANMVAFLAILKTRLEAATLKRLEQKNVSNLSTEEWNKLRHELGNQRLLALDYYSGGHLTHGYRFNVSAQLFESFSYNVNRETSLLDYDEIEAQAMEVRPFILMAGYSAYPRLVNFRRMREIADKVGAVFMVDMAHFAGLVAGKVFTGDYDPVPFAHVVTTTTHKTLRGPRGGMVLCTDEFSEQVDKGCPSVLGGPLPHAIAAKAVAFTEANTPQFKKYASKIVENCQTMAKALIAEGMHVVSGGTDNHLLLVDVRPFELNGRQAENALRECRLTMNRNALPFDTNGPWYTSGLRIGTPAITTLGMSESEMKEIASIIKLVLAHTKVKTLKSGKKSKAKYSLAESAKTEAVERVKTLLDKYPVYPQLDLTFLQEHFG
ncbi:MAG: serine hydroxymethyltransferase [Anaerolineaceae bacterium 4572_78]|nr:MAG: serine hydroxymethyltransferase [Anaerolineaceae bacterium 4572_78]